jgi:hypothetical protein
MSKASGLGSFAIGAILAFAIHAKLTGVSLPVVGVILMTVGLVAFVAGVYRDKWRERVVLGSLESGNHPPAGFRHGELIIERAPTTSSRDFVVHQHLATPEMDVVDGVPDAERTQEFSTATEVPDERRPTPL